MEQDWTTLSHLLYDRPDELISYFWEYQQSLHPPSSHFDHSKFRSWIDTIRSSCPRDLPSFHPFLNSPEELQRRYVSYQGMVVDFHDTELYPEFIPNSSSPKNSHTMAYRDEPTFDPTQPSPFLSPPPPPPSSSSFENFASRYLLSCHLPPSLNPWLHHPSLPSFSPTTPGSLSLAAWSAPAPLLVKMYQDPRGQLTLNQLVAFEGFVSMCFPPDEEDDERLDDNFTGIEFSDDDDPNPSSSSSSTSTSSVLNVYNNLITPHGSAAPPISELVPCLHVIRFRVIDSLSEWRPLPGTSVHPEQLRASMIDQLTPLLRGDDLLAEYLLCNLLSSVHSRVDSQPLGVFPLHILTQTPDGAPDSRDQNDGLFSSLQSCVGALCPASASLALDPRSLNPALLVPSKDHRKNVLRTAFLQLPFGTHLLVDETGPAASQSDWQHFGRSNIAALESLLKNQTLAYDFEFHSIDYPADIPLIVVSKDNSVLEEHIRVAIPHRPTTPAHYSVPVHYWPMLRQYLRHCRQLTFRPKISSEFLQHVEEAFVQLRQQDPTVQAIDLQSILTLTRLLAISRGETDWSLQDFDKANELERKRRIRLSSP